METLVAQFDEKLAELAWSLWTELGVAGTRRHHKDCLVSLEELIILTSVIADFDPRLRDEALDWCSRHHHFVSISRLRTLVKMLGEPVYLPVSVFAKTLNAVVQTNWPTFSEAKPINFKPSGKSSPPNCEAPALLGLRLRALFGVGARADLLTFFLTRRTTVTATDATEIGYGKRSLADLLDSLVQSGLLITSLVRNQRKYDLKMTDQLIPLVGQLPRITPPWGRILEALIVLRTTFQHFKKEAVATNLVAANKAITHISALLPPIVASTLPLQSSHNQSLISFIHESIHMLGSFASGNFLGNFAVEGRFAETVFLLMQDLYAVDDCLDGIEFIIRKSKEESGKHSEIFKEGYQLATAYVDDLDQALQNLLSFPFHQLMDVKLSDIAYQFGKNSNRKTGLRFLSGDSIEHPHQALRQYEWLQQELNSVHQFINEFKDRLKKIHFLKTDIHLLVAQPKLHKRHTVINLFSYKGQDTND